jgi:hypothetical protein
MANLRARREGAGGRAALARADARLAIPVVAVSHDANALTTIPSKRERTRCADSCHTVPYPARGSCEVSCSHGRRTLQPRPDPQPSETLALAGLSLTDSNRMTVASPLVVCDRVGVVFRGGCGARAVGVRGAAAAVRWRLITASSS